MTEIEAGVPAAPDYRRFRFVQSLAFTNKWQKLKLTDDDMRALEDLIASRAEDPSTRTDVGRLRKIRFAPSSLNTAKSGALRACYALFVGHGTVFLFTVYAKGEKSDLNAAEKAAVAEAIRDIEAQRTWGEF